MKNVNKLQLKPSQTFIIIGAPLCSGYGSFLCFIFKQFEQHL